MTTVRTVGTTAAPPRVRKRVPSSGLPRYALIRGETHGRNGHRNLIVLARLRRAEPTYSGTSRLRSSRTALWRWEEMT